MKFILLLFVLGFALLSGLLTLESFERLVKPQWAKGLPRRSPLYFAPALAVLFLIVVLCLSHIYPWMNVPQPAFRAKYLSPDFFAVRGFFYLLILGLLALRQRRVGGGAWMLALLLFVVSFASFDWVMSLDPEFHSTAFGAIFFASAALLAFGARTVTVTDSPHLININSVFLALIGSWTYLVFMQYLVNWTGNLPHEADWYLMRANTPWRQLLTAVIIMQAVLPIPALLFRKFKRSVTFTRSLGVITVVSQFVYIAWMVLPGGPR